MRRSSIGWATDALGRLLVARSDHGRLLRGKELADLERVLDIDVSPGRASAVVPGSRNEPYHVSLRVPVGPGLPDAARDLRFDCTCPDWGDPCKHGVALVLSIATMLDDEPDALARLRGPQPAPARPREPTAPARVGEAPLSTGRIAPPPREPPSWAENFGVVSAPPNIAEWLAAPRPLPDSVVIADGDPVERLLDLGPLRVDDGPDLAPALQLLVLRLLEGGG